MILLAPLALWLSAIGAAVVALYLLKVKRQRQMVPDLEFWRELTGQRQTRSLFQRLKRWLSLALWLLILTLLILSVANPVFTLGSIKPRNIVLVIDNSASMQAIEENGQTRLDLVLSDLQLLTTRRPVSDSWLLLEAGHDIRVLQGWTRRRSEITDAAERVVPYLGESNLAEAIELAGQLLAEHDRPTIVILTDGASGEAARIAATDERVMIRPVGERRDNAGITCISVRPNRQRGTQHVLLRVDNESDTPIARDLVLEVDETTVSIEPIEIAAGGSWEDTVVLEQPEGGLLRVYFEEPDALAADNEAFAVLPPIRSARVLLVSDELEAFFFEQALSAMTPLVDAASSATISPDDLATINWATASPDLVILNTPETPETLDARAILAVNSLPAWTGARAIGTVEAPRLEVSEPSHPLMRFLELGSASVGRATRVELVRPAEVLVQSADGDPLVFLSRTSDHDTLCVAFDVLESDLPFRNSFPVLLRNAVSHLVQEGAAWVPDQVQIGEPIVSRRPVPTTIGTIVATRLTDGEEIETILTPHTSSFRFEQTLRPGPVRFQIGDQTAFAAINLASTSETRLAPIILPDDAPALPLSAGLFTAPPWMLGGGLALGLILFEWASYHKRWTE